MEITEKPKRVTTLKQGKLPLPEPLPRGQKQFPRPLPEPLRLKFRNKDRAAVGRGDQRNRKNVYCESIR